MSASNPSQTYNKAVGTLQTPGESASQISAYASSRFSSNTNAISSFLSYASTAISQEGTHSAGVSMPFPSISFFVAAIGIVSAGALFL